MKRGVLLGVLPAHFADPAPAASSSSSEAGGAAAAAAAAAAVVAAAEGEIEASLSSSAGKAERKEGEHTDGEEDEEEAEGEEEKKERAGAAGDDGPASWRGQVAAYGEEEEAMWSYLAQANPRERSRMLVLRDQRRLEKLLSLTRVSECARGGSGGGECEGWRGGRGN
jgi:hypothetical protein